MQQPLTGFTNKKGEQAKWDDIAVTFRNKKGITANFYFNNNNKPYPKIGSKFTNDDRLNSDTHHLLLTYLLDLLKENISINVKREKLSIARNFLNALENNVASSSLSDIQHAIDNMGYSSYIATFFNWLYKHKMLSTACCPSFPIHLG
ncbi:hypothetical protein EAY73_21520 [Vibrio anguillarum]|nr:hypothetical protein [Vibrio anguillarum]